MRRVIASKVPAPLPPRQASPMTRTCARTLARVPGRHRYRGTYYGRGRDPESRAACRVTSGTHATRRMWMSSRDCCGASSLRAASSTPDARRASWSRRCESSTSTPRASTRAAGRSRMRRARSRPSSGAVDLAKRLPFPSGSFDVVTALETLEHVPPQRVPHALAELRRVCRGWVVVTIPSFGPNRGGPPGWLEGKVRDERLADLYALGSDFDGPVAEADLRATRRETCSRGTSPSRRTGGGRVSSKLRASCGVPRSSAVSIRMSRGSGSPEPGAST